MRHLPQFVMVLMVVAMVLLMFLMSAMASELRLSAFRVRVRSSYS